MVLSDDIAALNATPSAFAHLLAEATDDQLDEALPGEWPARVVLAHVRDYESLQLRMAVERMLAEDTPAITWIDNTTWAARRNATRDRKDMLLTDFALQRRASTAILESLRPEDWARDATGPNGTRFTIESLVTGWVQHDREHIAHLEQLMGETVAAAKERRARPQE